MQKLTRTCLVFTVVAMAALVTQPLSSNDAPTVQQFSNARMPGQVVQLRVLVVGGIGIVLFGE